MNIGLDGLKISERDTVGCISMIELKTKQHENTNKKQNKKCTNSKLNRYSEINQIEQNIKQNHHQKAKHYKCK